MTPSADGFDFAALVLKSMIGTGGSLDGRLDAISRRLLDLHQLGKGDRITAAIIVEAEASKSNLADSDILLAAAALIRAGPPVTDEPV